jgi:hypothetical protein
VPAAAVIPAPIAYIEVVAVKKFVVGRRRAGTCGGTALPLLGTPSNYTGLARRAARSPSLWRATGARATLRKIECSRQAIVCIC